MKGAEKGCEMTGETDSPGTDRIWASDFARMAAKEEADQMGLDYLTEAARSSEILQDISDSVKSGELLVYVRFAGVGMIERKANASEPKFPKGDFPLKAASVRKWFRGESSNVPAISAETAYRLPLFKRLEPVNPWRGGRIADIDVLALPEAAAMASKHAGQQVTVQDILRAAARGEIPLRAIVHCSAKTVACKPGDLPMNDGKPVPQGSIPTLPITACQALANTGRAEWRTFEWYAEVPAGGGVDARFDRWQLASGEPDFITTPDDCRVTGRDLHALADAFYVTAEVPPPSDSAQIRGSTSNETTAKRSSTRARRDDLSPVIEEAKRGCLNPLDVNEVWPRLVALATTAEGRRLFPILLGADEGGVKYRDPKSDVEISHLKKRSLDKRLNPNKRGKPKT